MSETYIFKRVNRLLQKEKAERTHLRVENVLKCLYKVWFIIALLPKCPHLVRMCCEALSREEFLDSWLSFLLFCFGGYIQLCSVLTPGSTVRNQSFLAGSGSHMEYKD